MKIASVLTAAGLALTLCAGCSSAPAATETTTPKTETVKETPKTETESKKDTTTESKTETPAAESNNTAAVTENATLKTITDDLRSRGYRIEKEYVDFDNGIDPSKVKQELECDGPTDYNIWEFNNAEDAKAAFANIEKYESMDYEQSVARDGSLLTITDREDGEREFYVLNGTLIVESDGGDAVAEFQTWGLLA